MDLPFIAQDTIAAYHRDGAVVLRQVLDQRWLDQVAQGLEEARANPGGMTTIYATRAGVGETIQDQYASLRNAKLREVVKFSPLAGIVAQLTRSPSVHYVLDQVFYKTAGTIVPTAFHQDTPYLRVVGHDLARTWICCDPSPPEATIGVIRGSHLWNVTYRPIEARRSDTSVKSVGKDFSYRSGEFDPSLPSLPDIEGNPESFDIMRWDIQPGDLLIFNGNAIHGAIDHCELPHPRRAFAVLWGGRDVRYLARPGHSIPDLAAMRNRPIESGEFVSERADIFDQCWPPSE